MFKNTLSSLCLPSIAKVIVAGCSVIAVAACTSLGTYTAPVAAVSSAYAAAPDAKSQTGRDVAWWKAFNDRHLDALVARGLGENLDIVQAIERINEAGAGVIAAGGAYTPGVTAGAATTVAGGSGLVSSSTLTGSTSATWLLGLFGQVRMSRDAANANLDAAYFTADVARLAFLSEVASAYIELRFYQEALALTRLGLATRKETLALTERLFDDGAGSRLDVLQAQSALDAASLEMPRLELGFIRAQNRLATLTAQSSNSLEGTLQKGSPQPWPRVRLDPGVPADLLRARPDINAAERKLAAATAEAGLAEAALYPSISLAGVIQVAGLAAGTSATWSFGPTLNLPFLDGGRSKANHQIAQSRVVQAYDAWRATVLQAVEEVENAIAAVSRDNRTIDAATKVVGTAEQALELSRQAYELGQVQILDVLTAERNLFDARISLAGATQQLALNYVALNVAVGTGIHTE